MFKLSVWPCDRLTAAAAFSTAALLGGCASGVKLDTPAPVESRSVSGGANAGAAGGANAGAPQSAVTVVDLGAAGDAGGLARTVYFDFDSFRVKDEYRPLIEGHARLLTANRQKRDVLEGHTDERGGREYNLALGQKRAEAVQKSLTLLGVPVAQLEAVSFGEERPAATGNDETAWAKNRRVEIKDR